MGSFVPIRERKGALLETNPELKSYTGYTTVPGVAQELVTVTYKQTTKSSKH